MSSEKQPTQPLTSDPSKKEEESMEYDERIEIGERAGEYPKVPENFLNSGNQGLLSRMSEGGKKIAGQAYDGLYKIPGISRVVGKTEIAYNQFWINHHEKKAAEFKNKMDGIDLQIGLFDQSKREIESVTGRMKQQNISGIASLQIRLGDIDRRKMGLLNNKDKVQTKFEARESKMKLYTNERDHIADKLIDRYGEIARPMEKELEKLQTDKDGADLITAVIEAKHKERNIELDNLEKGRVRLIENLRRTGMSVAKIRNLEAVKAISSHVAQDRASMRTEKENLARRKSEINREIAKLDARANPYRDKKEEFVRVKEGRPLNANVKARTRSVRFDGEEEIDIHTRRESLETEHHTDESYAVEDVFGTTERNKEMTTVASYVSGWNKYLQEKYGKEVSGEMVDPRDFIMTTRLSRVANLEPKDFENILTKYYKFRKMPTNKVEESIKKFLKERINS